MDLKKHWFWIVMIIMFIGTVFLFFHVSMQVKNQYINNCNENDTIKNITGISYNCDIINCISTSCVKYKYELGSMS
jgi:hypothetical protein